METTCALAPLDAEATVHRPATPTDNNQDPVHHASPIDRLKRPLLVQKDDPQQQQSPLLVRVSSIDDEDQEEDYGILPRTLEVVTAPRRSWAKPHEPPLVAPTATGASPILHEFTRTWRALRLRPAHAMDKKKELHPDQTLLKNYQPRFTAGESTFPSEVSIPSYLQPRIAAEDATAFLVTTRLRFTVGMLETLYCRLVLYDVQLCCRASEEFTFTVPAGATANRLPRAVFYTLPAHASSNLYLVLKVSKVLMGDGDLATTPYCSPERYASEAEQQRLIERTADSTRRLGRYQQPLGWGAVSLAGEGTTKSMTLYRQRATLGDDQRIPLIIEAARGTFKEKQLPSVCELDVDKLEEQRVDDAKYLHHKASSLKALGKDTSPPSILELADPFTPARSTEADECREVQPFCHAAGVSTYGLYGGGPIASCYVHTIYVYPLHVDKFGFRNVAIRVQLLAREAEYVCGMDQDASAATALYAGDHTLASAVFTEVNYHQKNPQFDREIKIALPEPLCRTHHLLFTFYHVHCKKLQPSQPQQELVGCAWLPLVAKDSGAMVEDNDYCLSVLPASAAAKNSTSGGIVALPTGYTDQAPTTDSSRASATWFSCRTRLVSSVRSQDAAVAAVLEPFQSTPINAGASHEAILAARLHALRKTPSDTLRHFMSPLLRCVLAYMRFGSSSTVRQAAFKALLTVVDRVVWVNPRSSAKPQDPKLLLLHWVALGFDDRAVESCASRVTSQAKDTVKKPPQSTVQALASEWLRSLKDDETRKLSLSYSGVLLQLMLKALTTANKADLPQRVRRDDELVMEDLLLALVEQSTNVSLGLLVQKEVNQSVASFCRSLFLVAKNALPFRVISHFLRWTQRLEGDVNVTVHILFPFLHSLIEFEFFAVVNGFHTDTRQQHKSATSHRRGAWLARLIFERLLRVVDEQVEDRVRSEALRLLRHTFAAHVYNPRHQTVEQQELIALMYLPMVPSIARFTTDGKLLAAGAEPVPEESSDRQAVFRRELLICVAHLLSSVTLPYLSWYFRQSCAAGDTIPLSNSVSPSSNQASASSLSPTAALLHYRKLVEETKLRAPDGRRQSVIQRNVDKAFTAGSRAALAAFDEVRVHACLSLVRQIIDAFLVPDDLGASVAPHVLSPDLAPRDTARISLLELEAHLKQRRSRHRGASVGQPEGMSLQRGSATTPTPKSPNAKHLGSSSGSFTAFSSAAIATPSPRLSQQKSLPRTWGKSYNQQLQQQQQRVSVGCDSRAPTASLLLTSSRRSGDDLEVDTSDDFDVYTQNLRRIVAGTALKALRTAVDQFDWVLRVIEGPLDYRTTRSHRKISVSVDQAITLLGALVDLFFLLLQRASAIDCLCSAPEANEVDEQQEEDADATATSSVSSIEDTGCFLAELFRHVHSFLLRFQKALFATRVAGLPLVHDQRRVQLLVTLSATAKLARVRQLAAALLVRLARVCYMQTGSFLLLQRPLLQVVCGNCFSTSALQIPVASLRDAIDLWQQQCQQDEDDGNGTDPTFVLQWHELMARLSSQLTVFEAWHDAMTRDSEDAVDYETLEDGLYEIVQSVSPHWLLDVKRCWMDALVQLHARRKLFAEATCCHLEAIAYKEQVNSDVAWLVTELRSAYALAVQAQWLDQALVIGERLLSTLRQSRCLTDYQDTLKAMDATVSQLGERGPLQAFYRVAIAGDIVKPSEFIYSRSKFTSLGEFVGELKAAVRANWPTCERVDIVPEAKPLPPFERHASVVFLRVNSVDLLDATTFQYATPFTRTGSGGAYGKTSEQMKRVVVLSITRSFPCPTRRQRVIHRREVVRCPVDNAMDDVRKRCALLEDEIDKETSGRTDLKTLTLVLKGSVDTHVHGGVPEVIEAFLVDGAALVDENGLAMDVDKSVEKREELADVLVEFLQLCWAALLISRLAFRRESSSSTTTMQVAPVPTKLPVQATSHGSSIARVLGTLALPLVDDDTASLSPLQVEFERGFGVLLDMMSAKVTFAYPRDGDLIELCNHVQSRRKQRTVSMKPSVAPLPAPPPVAVATVPLLPPPPPPIVAPLPSPTSPP